MIATGSTYLSKLKSFDTSSLYRLSELSKEHNELKKAKSVLIIGNVCTFFLTIFKNNNII